MVVDISLACHPYAWVQPLRDGRVEPEGMNLTMVNYPNPERFSRMIRNLEFDACEMSMGSYLATRRDTDRFPFTAVPIFPFRKFRHSYMYVRADSDVDSVTDLHGGRVGIANWQTTTGIWQRGILAEHHGLDLSEVQWVSGGEEIIDIDVPDDFDVEYLGHQGGTLRLLEDMIARGDLDAIFHPVDSNAENTDRLFDDAVAVEQEYYRETSIFPIMHAIVLRDELLEDKPWVVQKLYDAFETAKEVGLGVLDRPRELPLVWADAYADEQEAVLGEDPWEYGLTEDNVTTIETLVGYAHDQAVAAERYDISELFVTDPLETEYFG